MERKVLIETVRGQLVDDSVFQLLLLSVLLVIFDIVVLAGIGFSVLSFHAGLRTTYEAAGACMVLYLVVLINHMRLHFHRRSR